MLLVLLAAPGCYYGHLAAGQARLLLSRRSVEEVLRDPTTPAPLAARIRLVREAVAFGTELGLSARQQYTSYVAWPGDRVVTTVVATRPGEITARGFWFPVVGTVPYKGFFDAGLAAREAQALARRGLDTCLVPVVAYSTLGWFEDPLTSPLLELDEDRLVETILHELVHATVFVPGDADFAEGLATFFGQEAAVRFAERFQDPERVRRRVREDRAVADTLQGFRDAVRALYAETPEGPARDGIRETLAARTRAALAALPLTTREAPRVAEAARLNDACQALAGTYQADLSAYEARLGALGGDLRAFLSAARRAAGQEDPRAALLRREGARR